MKDKIIWQDRKRTWFGLPWSFTKYMLSEDKLRISTGFLNKKEEEIRLYRIMDTTLERPLGQRIFGLGTIKCNSSDRTTPVFYIKRVKASANVRDLLSEAIENERDRKKVSAREFMADDDDDDDNY